MGKGKDMLKKGYKVLEYAFGIVLAIQIGCIFFFNLSDTRCSIDPDWANTVYHFRQVIEQGTLQLQDWQHTTSLELDGSFLFALPLYFLTKNLFTAVGISNLIITAVYIGVIGRLLHHIGVKRLFIYVTLLLVLTPYAFSMLDYFNMMFYGGACYSVKTIVPILLISLLVLMEKRVYLTVKGSVELTIMSCLYVFLLFSTIFSTGLYVVLCGILPIMVWLLLEAFIRGKADYLKSRGMWCIMGVTTAVTAMGLIFHNRIYTAISRTNMKHTKIEHYGDNFSACVRGIFELFGAVTAQDVEVLSREGIFLLVKMVFTTAFLIALMMNYVKFSPSAGEGEVRVCIKNYLGFLFVWSFMVMLIADMRYPGNEYTEYRYFLIGAVPLVILFGIQLAQLESHFNDFQKIVGQVVLFVACITLIYANNKGVADQWDRSTYAVELTEYIDTLGVEGVIFLDDKDSALMCKGIDADHEYGAFMSETKSMYMGICSYYESAYGYFYGDRHALAVIQGMDMHERLPAEAAENYEYVGRFKWFDLYVSDVMLLP